MSFPRLCIAIVLFGLAGFGVHRLHEHQLGGLAALLRQQADEARLQGQHGQYLKYLSQYVEQNSNEVDALAELAAEITAQSPTKAQQQQLFLLLDRICQLDPARHDSRRQLAGIAMDPGRSRDALSHLRLLEKVTPEDGEVKLLIGRCCEQVLDIPGAFAAYRASIELSPGQQDAYEGLVRLLGMYEQADPLWQQLADQQPQHLQLQLLAFESSLNSGHRAAAAEALSRIAALLSSIGWRWRGDCATWMCWRDYWNCCVA